MAAPRLWAVGNGKVVEYDFGFECSRFEEFSGENRLRHEPISSKAQPAFDKPLQDMGRPIAPKWQRLTRCGSQSPRSGPRLGSLLAPARRSLL
jgi:hypothetical protein